MIMRKYISIIFGAFLLSLAACTEEIVDPNVVIGEGNRVILSLTSPGVNVTRSADTDVESALALIDVYIMDKDYNFVYTERIDNTASPVSGEGKFTLEKGRDEFEADKEYFVYIVANSTVEMADDWAELKSLTQKNSNVHLSGMNITNVASGDFPPKFFLMDGFAYVGDREPEDMSTLVINDSSTDDTVLKATLYRAAAKLIINITQGESVQFHQSLEGAGPLFSFYQLPISTLVVNPSLTAGRHVSEKQTTVEWGLSNNNFHWNTDKNGKPVLTLVGYAYANDWSGNNNAANETALLLSVPMTWDSNDDGTPDKDSPVNWYKVPVSKNEKLERNKCYVINVNINAVGAEEINVPLELKDIEYVTLDWQEVEVKLGENEARYLTLNTDLVKIYDSNFDLDQLTFTSSSPIKSIKLKDVYNHHDETDAIVPLQLTKESDGETEAVYEGGDGVYAYYVDKFGKKVQLGTDPGFDITVVEKKDLTKEQILALENNLYAKSGVAKQYIRAEVAEEHKRALNGDIHIYSPINVEDGNDDLNWSSHFNTVRYLEFEVMNEQGLTATFRVEQTPVTVIRNIEGFFSYRDDYVVAGEFQYNADAFSSAYGKIRPENNGPIHYLNPKAPFFALAGFLPYHIHETTENGTLKSTSCGGYVGYEELLYGFMERVYHRTYAFGGPVAGIFHRDHYVTTGGGHLGSSAITDPSKYYQAIGFTYYDESTGKYYRRHYTGNFFETFWAKYVAKVYKEDGQNIYGRPRLKGQADIAKQVPNDDFSGWDAQTLPRFMANHRMYYIRVTTTSNKYTVAVPKLMDENGNPTDDRERGYTLESADNANVVSPSFMVASQLGESILPKNEHHYVVPGIEGIYYYAKRQCQEYVETRYEDLNGNGEYNPGEPVYHYNDWRLPTSAEIEYIIEHQDISRAMDKVLYAQYYYHASEVKGVYDENTVISREVPGWLYLPDMYPEENWKEDQSYKGWYMRCVRDAFKEPAPVVYDANYNIVNK